MFNWDRVHNYPWSREVAVIFSLSDFNFIFRNNLQCNINTIERKLLKIYKEQWKEDICKKPKLRNYIQIKDDYYLQRRQRSLCAQLRTGSLPLAIEVGRYKGIPEEERLCVFCDLGVVKDEFHFIFHCPLYSDLRNCLYEKIKWKNPDLFWLSDADVLSWLFNMEIFVLVRSIGDA